MITQSVDNVEFQLKEPFDLSFLSTYGKVFCVFDKNDSGNISFGTDDGCNKYFIKIAGVKTENYTGDSRQAVTALRSAMALYKELKHPSLIELLDSYPLGEVYVAVFRWAAGDCLFDYWNFEKYAEKKMESPMSRFMKLPIIKRLESLEVVFEFLLYVEAKGFVAIDFYDGSILYDFSLGKTTICDIDFFRKKPAVNDMGINFWGSKRLESPEEYILGAPIDEKTNVHTLGAMMFHFFGRYTDNEIQRIYKESRFYPCTYGNWDLNEALYNVALRAADNDRAVRYSSVKDFYAEWKTKLLDSFISGQDI